MTKWKLRFSIVEVSSAFDQFKAEADVGCKHYADSTHVPLICMSLATHCTEEKQSEPIKILHLINSTTLPVSFILLIMTIYQVTIKSALLNKFDLCGDYSQREGHLAIRLAAIVQNFQLRDRTDIYNRC